MTGEIPCCFAIVPDNDNDEAPTAAFQNLEDALDWGVLHFGGNNFRIRHLRLVAVACAPANDGAAAPEHN
jgi:hypothetical protein